MTEEDKKTKDEIILELLSEFKVHRDAIMEMIGDLEKIKVSVDKLIPTQLDARHIRFFEEKIKTITELFKTLLEMRKEIQKSLKEELELRRKIKIGDDDDDLEKHLDIRALATKVEEFQATRAKMKQSTIEKSKEETDQVASTLVQVTESG